MARPVDARNREKIKEKIMEAARAVFCEKGFVNVTMSDLIEASGMSRGGFYFYYKSVEDVFKDTVRNRKRRNFNEIMQLIERNPDFFSLLDDYFEKQKARLLNMKQSLLRSLLEYLFTHSGESDDNKFRDEQKDNILQTVTAILKYGLQIGAISHENIEIIADHYVYTIEGLNTMALFQGLTEETVDQQFEVLKKMIRA